MELQSRSYVLYLIVASILISSYCSNCEQLSTVFVLEPSDYSASDSAPSSLSLNGAESSALIGESSNTRIITDDGPSPSSSPVFTLNSNKSSKATPKVSVNQQSSHNQHTSETNARYTAASSSSQNHKNDHLGEDQDDAPPMSRRLEEESQYPASTRLRTPSTTVRSSIVQQPTSAPASRPKSIPSTTSSPTSSHDNGDHSTPKSEERLLISITSDEDDYKPNKQGISSGGLSPDGTNSNLGIPRKPSITISIQDNANLKQNGGGPGSAVILRPTDDGQHIVISTLGGAQLATSQLNGNNNYNSNQKPGVFSVLNPSGGSGIGSINNNNNNNNNRDPPSREPLDNIPISSGSSIFSSTYRPSLNNNERPLTSTLLDQQRPSSSMNGNDRPNRPNEDRPVRLPILDNNRPSQRPNLGGNDDRPARPINQPDETNYDLRPPTQRPSSLSRPINQPDMNGGYNDNDDLNRPNNININNNNQQLQQGESKYPLSEKSCGLVHETRIVGGEEANPDDFLWMAAIIKSKPVNGEARPFCGGSLITRRHILTAAHCLENLAPRDVLVRLGSYDFDDSTASSLSADYAIDQFRVPASYSKKTHASDIAIMRLKTPLSPNDNYKTVCMPQPRRSYVGALGTVTGYGSQSQTFRRAAPKLRQVTVPVWENRKCSVVYKKNLTESFLCAGYEEGGKDACQGDSGGPLMTEGPGERMMIIGVVSHGIGCGAPGYPGVYTRTTTYLDWIEKNTRE